MEEEVQKTRLLRKLQSVFLVEQGTADRTCQAEDVPCQSPPSTAVNRSRSLVVIAKTIPDHQRQGDNHQHYARLHELVMRLPFVEPNDGQDKKFHTGEGHRVGEGCHTGAFDQEPILDAEVDCDDVVLTEEVPGDEVEDVAPHCLDPPLFVEHEGHSQAGDHQEPPAVTGMWFFGEVGHQPAWDEGGGDDTHE